VRRRRRAAARWVREVGSSRAYAEHLVAVGKRAAGGTPCLITQMYPGVLTQVASDHPADAGPVQVLWLIKNP
jgi:hypothetical protein